jgi:hypothetical protein
MRFFSKRFFVCFLAVLPGAYGALYAMPDSVSWETDYFIWLTGSYKW